MRLIIYLLDNFRFVFFLSIITGFISGASGVGLIYLISLSLHSNSSAQPSIDEQLVWAFIALCLTLFFARVTTNLLLAKLGQTAVFTLRMKLTKQIVMTPLRRLQEIGSGRLYALVTDDVGAIATACELLPLLLINFAIVISCLGYLGWISWQVLLLVAGIIAIGVLSFSLIQRKALGNFRAAREQNDFLFSHLRGLTEGIKELQLRRESRFSFMKQNLESVALAYRNHYMSGMVLFALASNWGHGLFYVAVGVILFALPKWSIFPTDILTGSVLSIIYMMAPLSVIMNNLPVLGRAGIALGKIAEFNQELSYFNGDEIPEVHATTPHANYLVLNRVVHRYDNEYDDRGFCLGPISLTLVPGELIFLVGGNGSGKTTLALLLVGLYKPEAGEVLLNGQRIGDAEREHYRQHFSAVFSDFYLFDSLLGFENRDLDGEAREYLIQLKLDHKVKIDNGRFSTIGLSHGQRKRLALLVAYLEDRPFYLFDEWAADQDPLFKKIFYTEILPALKAKGKTVVVITHDDGYFHLADRCLRLENGKISEVSVPSKLAAPEVKQPEGVHAFSS